MLNKAFICADCSDSFKEGWATILKDNQLYTYCCYSCYQSNPIIVPTESKFKSSNEKVVLPTIIDMNDSFEFLSETEINQLTNQPIVNQSTCQPIQQQTTQLVQP